PPTRVEDDTQPPPAKPTWRQQPAPARKTAWTLVGVGWAVLLGLLGWRLVLQFLGDYQLEPPEPVLLKAGHSNTVNVRVQRSRFDGLINFAATKAPHGVTLTGFIKAGADNADVTIRAEPDAELGEFTMRIRAEAEGHAAREARLALTIEPSYWNPGWRVAQGAELIQDMQRRRHWSRIEIDYDGVPVRFVLVPQKEEDIGDGK